MNIGPLESDLITEAYAALEADDIGSALCLAGGLQCGCCRRMLINRITQVNSDRSNERNNA